jgi:hypothetical protein
MSGLKILNQEAPVVSTDDFAIAIVIEPVYRYGHSRKRWAAWIARYTA